MGAFNNRRDYSRKKDSRVAALTLRSLGYFKSA